MSKEILSTETVNQMWKSIGLFGEELNINLIDISRKDNLCTFTGTRNNGLHLVRSKVLSLIDKNECVVKSVTTNHWKRKKLNPMFIHPTLNSWFIEFFFRFLIFFRFFLGFRFFLLSHWILHDESAIRTYWR